MKEKATKKNMYSQESKGMDNFGWRHWVFGCLLKDQNSTHFSSILTGIECSGNFSFNENANGVMGLYLWYILPPLVKLEWIRFSARLSFSFICFFLFSYFQPYIFLKNNIIRKSKIFFFFFNNTFFKKI